MTRIAAGAQSSFASSVSAKRALPNGGAEPGVASVKRRSPAPVAVQVVSGRTSGPSPVAGHTPRSR